MTVDMMETKLLCAFQVLSMDDGALSVTHEDARRIVEEITAYVIPPEMGTPQGLSLEGYIAWCRENA
jgi:hypothetical protein